MGKPVNFTPSKYKEGEIRALIAPIFGVDAEDIDTFIIIARGNCQHCHRRDGYNTIENPRTFGEYAEMINEAMSIRIEKETRGPNAE